MALITVTNGDSDIDRDILASTLRLISEQPSDWLIRVDFDDRDDRTTVDGTIVEWDGTTLVIAEHDQEAMATGAQETLDIHHITEIEVY